MISNGQWSNVGGGGNSFSTSDFHFESFMGTIIPSETIPSTGRYTLSLEISNDGNTLLYGAAYLNYGGYTRLGKVYVFRKENSIWTEEAIIEPELAYHVDLLTFGDSCKFLNIAGDLIAINSKATVESVLGAGLIFVYKRTGNSWNLSYYIQPSILHTNDNIGITISVSINDGVIVASSYLSRRVFIFQYTDIGYTELQIITASDTINFGIANTISSDGTTLVVRSIDNNITHSRPFNSLYKLEDGLYIYKYTFGDDKVISNYYRYALQISSDGQYLVIGSSDYSEFVTNGGYVAIYKLGESSATLIWSEAEQTVSGSHMGYFISTNSDFSRIVVSKHPKRTFLVLEKDSSDNVNLLTTVTRLDIGELAIRSTISSDSQYLYLGGSPREVLIYQ